MINFTFSFFIWSIWLLLISWFTFHSNFSIFSFWLWICFRCCFSLSKFHLIVKPNILKLINEITYFEAFWGAYFGFGIFYFWFFMPSISFCSFWLVLVSILLFLFKARNCFSSWIGRESGVSRSSEGLVYHILIGFLDWAVNFTFCSLVEWTKFNFN